jgi:iron complex transport system ATP-binding protein
MIRACGVTVARGARVVVREVSFAVAPGELLAVVGPSGSGKSSLLAALCGDLAPAAGRVLLDGRPLDGYAARDLARARAVLPQSSALSFPYRVAEVVRLGRAPHDGGDDRRVAAQALEAVGLEALATRRYPSLSGGEKQRVHLARVLAQLAGPPRGRALFLDEPTAHLDVGAGERVLAVLRDIAARAVAVLVVLHDLNLAARHADRVAVLSGGRLVALGPPDEALREETLSAVFDWPIERVERPGRPPLFTARESAAG